MGSPDNGEGASRNQAVNFRATGEPGGCLRPLYFKLPFKLPVTPPGVNTSNALLTPSRGLTIVMVSLEERPHAFGRGSEVEGRASASVHPERRSRATDWQKDGQIVHTAARAPRESERYDPAWQFL